MRPGVNGVVFNAGTIKSTTTTGSSSDGVDAQNNSGVQITNDTGGLIEGGRHGITGGAVDATVSFTMSVTNNAGATIQGDNGSGINIDGFNANEVLTVVNHGTITGNGTTSATAPTMTAMASTWTASSTSPTPARFGRSTRLASRRTDRRSAKA